MAEEEPPASANETPEAAAAEEATGSVGAGAPGAEEGGAEAEATIHEEEGEGGAEAGAETAGDGSPPDGPADTFPSADDGVPKTSEKISRMQALDPADLPPSYSSNSPEELLVLEYVENFRRQFVQLYPDRKDLLLVPRNECGVEKFLCTTVRPTQLEYSDLYDLEDCASFVAEHIQYEALTDPVALPMYVPSPSSVLTWQMGDCFDMSIVLASLLLGVGYDAYVVVGYADRTTCLADETRVELPFGSDGGRLKLSTGEAVGKAKGEQEVDNKGGDDGDEAGQYQVPHRPPLDSHFTMLREKMVRMDEKLFAAESEQRAATGQAGDVEEPLVPDELEGRRVHCWVLVRAGKREVAEDVFVEASTGKVRPTSDAAFVHGCMMCG